ncbi:metal ABC transporter ATP-binding protein [Holzapfeliella saturejae]|uniref:metal ABC transporter ATP-binding protein n=1 Tax=Holzapfeliella saturejae TaxID=3082953 RepID=UPI00399C8040
MKITTNQLAIGYDQTKVVTNLQFELLEGDFIALVGANGAGKSTLLNSLIGILPTVSGELSWEFDPHHNHNPMTYVGFSPQSQLMDWYTTVYDNVMLGPLLAGFTKKTAQQKSEEALKLLDIYQLRNNPVDHLSGGQQQRVQIAREIARDPDIYLLDEPTTGLDIETAESLFTFLNQKAKEGRIVLTSSHDLTLLDKYSDKILFIDEGKQQFFGTITDFIADSNLNLREKYLKEREVK